MKEKIKKVCLILMFSTVPTLASLHARYSADTCDTDDPVVCGSSRDECEGKGCIWSPDDPDTQCYYWKSRCPNSPPSKNCTGNINKPDVCKSQGCCWMQNRCVPQLEFAPNFILTTPSPNDTKISCSSGEEQCVNKNCCWETSVKSFNETPCTYDNEACAAADDDDNELCVKQSNKYQVQDITETQCLSFGCCWSKEKDCRVRYKGECSSIFREDCGISNVLYCLQEGCCWDNSKRPFCFERKQLGVASSPTKLSSATTSGSIVTTASTAYSTVTTESEMTTSSTGLEEENNSGNDAVLIATLCVLTIGITSLLVIVLIILFFRRKRKKSPKEINEQNNNLPDVVQTHDYANENQPTFFNRSGTNGLTNHGFELEQNNDEEFSENLYDNDQIPEMGDESPYYSTTPCKNDDDNSVHVLLNHNKNNRIPKPGSDVGEQACRDVSQDVYSQPDKTKQIKSSYDDTRCPKDIYAQSNKTTGKNNALNENLEKGRKNKSEIPISDSTDEREYYNEVFPKNITSNNKVQHAATVNEKGRLENTYYSSAETLNRLQKQDENMEENAYYWGEENDETMINNTYYDGAYIPKSGRQIASNHNSETNSDFYESIEVQNQTMLQRLKPEVKKEPSNKVQHAKFGENKMVENVYYASEDVLDNNEKQDEEHMINNTYYDGTDVPIGKTQNVSKHNSENCESSNDFYESIEVQNKTTSKPKLTKKPAASNLKPSSKSQAVAKEDDDISEETEYVYTYGHFKLEGRERSPHKK